MAGKKGLTRGTGKTTVPAGGLKKTTPRPPRMKAK